jgi:hypothetical protein
MEPEGSLPHKFPASVLILSQLDQIHTLTSSLLKIHLNIILPSTSGSPKWSLPLRIPQQNPVYAFALHESPISLFSVLHVIPLIFTIHFSYQCVLYAHPSPSSLIFHPHNILRVMPILQLVGTVFFPVCFHVLLSRSKCSLRRPTSGVL